MNLFTSVVAIQSIRRRAGAPYSAGCTLAAQTPASAFFSFTAFAHHVSVKPRASLASLASASTSFLLNFESRLGHQLSFIPNTTLARHNWLPT